MPSAEEEEEEEVMRKALIPNGEWATGGVSIT